MKKNNVRLFALALAFSGSFSAFAQTPEQKAEIVKHYDQKKSKELYERLKHEEEENYKEALKLAEQNNWPLHIKVEGGTGILTRVNQSGNPVYIVPYNRGAAQTARVLALQPGGGVFGFYNLDGAGMEIGIWEPGNVRKNHQELIGAVTVMDGANYPSADAGNDTHATHVTGTMISRGVSNSDYRGLAYAATVLAHNSVADESEAILRASDGLLVSNHSYGPFYGNMETWELGAYIQDSRDWDQITHTHKYYLPVFAAGNDRNDVNLGTGDDPDLLYDAALAKNVVTVAAVQEVDSYSGPSSVVMSSFSSYGPADDLRVKPDIATKGVAVWSCSSESNTSYIDLNGTSMAAPGVAASLILMQQAYSNFNDGAFMRAATLKGLMIHTADEAGFADGPDHRFGWGLINTTAAVRLLDAAKNNGEALVREDEFNFANNSYVKNVVADSEGVIKVTLSWTDPEGPIVNNGTIDLDTPVLVNDLDVRLTTLDGETVYFPWRLNSSYAAERGDNSVDNVEVIEAEGLTPGEQYVITVNYKGNLSNLEAQQYSLIISGITGVSSVDDVKASSFAVYPNPANGVLNINLTSSLQGQTVVSELYDVQGRFVKSFGAQTDNLNIDGIAPGVYVLTVKVASEGFVDSQKVIIK